MNIIRSFVGGSARKALTFISITVLIFVLSMMTVFAGSLSFSGTVTTSDPSYFNCTTGDHQEIFSFSVSQSGTYSFTSVTPASNNADNFFYVFASAVPTASNSFQIFGANNEGTNTSGFIQGDTTYYFHVGGCTAKTAYPVNYNFTITGPGDICSPSCGSQVAVPVDRGLNVTGGPPDERLNFQYGDLNAVVYDHSDGVVVYCYNEGASSVGFLVTQDVIDNADPNSPQAVPVMQAEDCGAYFYILDSGEYQINIFTPDGNKYYELISDTLNFRGATKRYFDATE